jgi:hypothetical protein
MTFGIMVTSKLDSSNTMMMCGSFPARIASCDIREVEPIGSGGVGLQHTPRHEIDGRDSPRPGELGDLLVQKELVLAVHRKCE